MLLSPYIHSIDTRTNASGEDAEIFTEKIPSS